MWLCPVTLGQAEGAHRLLRFRWSVQKGYRMPTAGTTDSTARGGTLAVVAASD